MTDGSAIALRFSGEDAALAAVLEGLLPLDDLRFEGREVSSGSTGEHLSKGALDLVFSVMSEAVPHVARVLYLVLGTYGERSITISYQDADGRNQRLRVAAKGVSEAAIVAALEATMKRSLGPADPPETR